MDNHELEPGLDLRALQRTSWEVAESKGFHKAQVELDPELLALYLRLLLTIGEFSEAAEELREGNKPDHIYYEHTVMSGAVAKLTHPVGLWSANDDLLWLGLQEHAEEARGKYDYDHLTVGKPAGFPIELADALIRLCDLAEGCGVDLSLASKAKEDFNRTRAYLHGKTA